MQNWIYMYNTYRIEWRAAYCIRCTYNLCIHKICARNDVYVCTKYYTLIFRIKGDETSSTTGESSRTSNNRDLSPSTHPVNIIRQEPAAAGEIIFPDKPAEVTYILTSRLHVKSFNISIYAVAVYFTYVVCTLLVLRHTVRYA